MKRNKKKVVRLANSKYLVNLSKSGSLVFTALKVLAQNKKRTDTAKVMPKQVAEMKKAKTKAEFFKLVDKYIVEKAKVGSSAKKLGLTKNTAYDAAHFKTAKALGLKFAK